MTRTDTPARPAPLPASRHRPQVVGPGEALLAAQGQSRRGLKAGISALVEARTAYGETQWSGENDRRPGLGLLVRARL